MNELKWQTLSAAVNAIKSPNQFLKKRFFSNHQTYGTEDIEVHVIEGGREIAPFIRKNGEAVMAGGYSWKRQVVSPPNIRIKRPFTPSELLFNRQPGSVIYPTGQDMAKARQAHIARDLQRLADLCTNAEEWLCSQAIQGTISYSVVDGEVFTITYPKPSTHNITLSTFWNDATPANVTFHQNIKTVKRLIADAVGLGVTDCILGQEASDAFTALAAGGYIKGLITTSGITSGGVDFTQQYNDDGVLFLGQVDGIKFWEYSRTADLNGTATSMIRSKYAEFIAGSPAAERELAYGAIADMDALEGRVFQSERFSKTWTLPDPSVRNVLIASRPLPIPRKVGAHLSMKVVSG